MTALLRGLWDRFQGWRTWRSYRRVVEQEIAWGFGDPETEAMAAGTRCPEDLEPCECAGGCERHGYQAATVRHYRAKHVYIGRAAAAMRRVAFRTGNEPELVRRAEEAEQVLRDLREGQS